MAVLVEIVVLTVKSAMPQKALAVLLGFWRAPVGDAQMYYL